MRRSIFLLALLAGACGGAADHGPADVSLIGDAPALIDPSQRVLSPASAVLLSTVAQGLVRFDAAGQIEPGLAIRWDVSDDGLYYTFRLKDDPEIDAEDAAHILNAAIGPTSRNPLKPVLGAIEEIVAVTPDVIEIRLRAPRPNFLQLLAQPELAIIGKAGGTGPMRIAKRSDATLIFDAIHDDDDGTGDDEADDHAAHEVRLRTERAALAVARFADGGTDAVIGGRFTDLPVARAAALPPRDLRLDPVAGLFGLAIVETDGFLGSAEGRRALSMAIDRALLGRIFGVAWAGQSSLLPGGLPDLQRPTRPDWADTALVQRRSIAKEAVDRWVREQGAPPLLRVALPEGPGARLLLTLLRREWGAIGVPVIAVPLAADADLRLIDEVAPADIASWYLRRFTCDRSRVCSEEADALLVAAREAPSLAERSARLADADVRFAEITPFIPLAAPLRWSLVSARLPMWKENARGVHPLEYLRGEAP